MKTTAIMINAPGVSHEHIDAQVAAVSFWGPACVIGVILATTAWVARKIIRHYKNSL